MGNKPAIKRDKPKKKTFKLSRTSRNIAWDILIAVLTFALIYAILITAVSPEKHEITVGDIPSEPIPAPRDVEDKLATEARIETALASVEDIYTIDNNITTNTITALYDVYNQIDDARQKGEDRIENWRAEQADDVTNPSNDAELDAPTNPDNAVDPVNSAEQDEEELQLEPNFEELFDNSFIEELQALFPIELSQDSIMTILSSEEGELGSLKTTLESSMREMLNEGIKAEELEESKLNLAGNIQDDTLTSELVLLGTNIGVNLLEPNLLYDAALTNERKQDIADNTERVMYIKGQYIVNAGQPVTEAQMEMLAELGLLKDKIDFSLIAGIFICVLICLGIIILYLIYFERELIDKPSVLLMISLILCFSLGFTYATSLLNPYLIPAAMAGMLLAILTKPRTAIVVNIVLAVLVSYMLGMQMYALLMTLAGGMVGVLLVQAKQQRYAIAWSGIAVSFVSILAIVSSEMLSTGGWQSPLHSSLYGLLSGILASILTIGTLPIWENIFGVITPIRLVELANPNQPILKRLLMETPGTYHHSIIVANLAESAADAIGANGLMARVGAYYHDIGKLVRPYYFKENQLYLENPHDKLNPVLSKKIITSHTKDGIELANKYNIPKILQDFISQHHGTTATAYFYHKAKENDSSIDLDEFRYAGPKPSTKEIALVMLADTVEAAVRSMSERSSEKIEEQIRKLIKDKLADGQLDESELTMKDLDTIANTFTNVISGIFHERIEYPDISSLDERTKLKNDTTIRG